MYRDSTNVERELYGNTVIIGATRILTKVLNKNLKPYQENVQ
jgi:hypothetical protein